MKPGINMSKNGQSKKKKRGSMDKKNQNINRESNYDNFWDIEMEQEDIKSPNSTSIQKNKKLKHNSFINKNNSIENEKSKNITFYRRYKNLLQNENKNNISSNCEKKRKENRNNSVEIKKIKIKSIISNELSVFERNQKWLENKKEKLNKEVQKYINKQNKEFLENNIDYTKTNRKERNKNRIYNEEDNVSLKKENYNFFMRLMEGRKERERSSDYNTRHAKINCLKKSHYSGRQMKNMTYREMRRYIKYIHNELKELNNHN